MRAADSKQREPEIFGGGFLRRNGAGGLLDADS
jgi:hypothetical protein